MLTPRASAAGLQANAATPSAQVETPSPAISDSLRPALEQVGHSVSQIQIDHWKVSKSWKEQLQSDADSITGDLSHQLPGLLQQAQATPNALDAQLRVMQNVDALYDVLVRLTLAADMTEKKSDAALLDSALERLESARKAATAQLVTAAAQQHQQLSDCKHAWRLFKRATLFPLRTAKPSWWTMKYGMKGPITPPTIKSHLLRPSRSRILRPPPAISPVRNRYRDSLVKV